LAPRRTDADMAADGFDLDAYLRRLCYAGPREPSLSVLAAVVAAHAAAIPYENIDVLLRRGVSLDLDRLRHKLVEARRGGYCFEHNTLLEAALKSLGFAVTGLAARVLRGLPLSAETARGHKLLRVDLAAQACIVDVGFGNLTPTAPIALSPELVQATPHETFRVVPHGGEFLLQAQLGEVWDSLYRFGFEPALPVDFVMANWYASTFPGSGFLANLIVARPIRDGRMTLYNRRFTIRDRGNRTTRRTLDGIADYRDVLAGEFGLTLDNDELAAIAAAMASHAPDEEVHRAFM
jgi:N-hydroxyarylamine O-acetyltransferase